MNVTNLIERIEFATLDSGVFRDAVKTAVHLLEFGRHIVRCVGLSKKGDILGKLRLDPFFRNLVATLIGETRQSHAIQSSTTWSVISKN